MAMAAEKTKKLTEREKVNRMEKMNWMVLELEKVLRNGEGESDGTGWYLSWRRYFGWRR
jgi:hypothetical protein